MKSITFLATAFFAAAHALEERATSAAEKEPTPTAVGVQEPSAEPTLNVITVQGCFSGPGELVFNSTIKFNTKGSCAQDTCFNLGYPVAATSGGNQCYCGKKYPPKDKLADDNKCNIGCTGYNLEACGGVRFWTVYNTGLSLSVDTSGEEEFDHPESGTTSTKSPTAVVTLTGSTAVVTQTIAPSDEPKGSTTNVGAIAAGVVVSVVVVAAAIAGMFFFLRRKRNKEIEEEHRRNAAVNSFSGKPPSSSGGMSILDARLDPVMAQRRMSDGSIADNQDYSRKILRVTNA
ncbi:hypothetical protein B0T25DRAFT_226444 [Lasiosphaeria hispida]|uniref:WSC domain-containing protein n=1 Tax=Lasiosphaeria hispida TaxID=260671 RepID=A0AAJ0HDH1_9PEZI|nr:hypothetical protein B0T25DRAFT_226444 [Lasiosphaeria hispida]